MKYLKRFNENNIIDWSIYDDYLYSEGDGLYLDEDELRNGRVVTTDRKTPFINIKHPLGEHTMNRSMNDSLSKQRSMIRKEVYGEEPERCSGCGEYKPSVSRNHDDMETIPLCKSCYNEDY